MYGVQKLYFVAPFPRFRASVLLSDGLYHDCFSGTTSLRELVNPELASLFLNGRQTAPSNQGNANAEPPFLCGPFRAEGKCLM